jgi:TolA-binding protein
MKGGLHKSEGIHTRRTLFAGIVFALLLSACAGKDDIAPADVEKQAFEDLRAAIRDAVVDAEREAEAVRLVDQLERDLADLRTRISERRKTVNALNADYDTPREDFEKYLVDVAKQIRLNCQVVSETQKALGKAITDEEGAAIARAHTNAMQAAVAAIQSI